VSFTVATPITCVFSAYPIRTGGISERANRAGFEFRQQINTLLLVGIGARDDSHASSSAQLRASPARRG
jgi:hypothetical protein